MSNDAIEGYFIELQQGFQIFKFPNYNNDFQIFEF